MNTSLKRLRTKLERMELEHLRQFALETQTKLEEAQSEIELLKDCLDMHQRIAEIYEDAAMGQLESTHRCIGMTKTGALSVVSIGGTA